MKVFLHHVAVHGEWTLRSSLATRTLIIISSAGLWRCHLNVSSPLHDARGMRDGEFDSFLDHYVSALGKYPRFQHASPPSASWRDYHLFEASYSLFQHRSCAINVMRVYARSCRGARDTPFYLYKNGFYAPIYHEARCWHEYSHDMHDEAVNWPHRAPLYQHETYHFELRLDGAMA